LNRQQDAGGTLYFPMQNWLKITSKQIFRHRLADDLADRIRRDAQFQRDDIERFAARRSV
jgi:hypothetical protein